MGHRVICDMQQHIACDTPIRKQQQAVMWASMQHHTPLALQVASHAVKVDDEADTGIFCNTAPRLKS